MQPMVQQKPFPTPKQMLNELNKYVVGQEKAKEIVVTGIHSNFMRVLNSLTGDEHIGKNNILFFGSSGTGKTYLLRKACEIANVPFCIYDCAALSSAGYAGDNVSNIILNYMYNVNDSLKRNAGCDRVDFFLEELHKYTGVIVLDEFTKKRTNADSRNDVGGSKVLFELLKLVEGKTELIEINKQLIEVDTSNILFIACGAAYGLEDVTRKRLTKKSIGFTSDNSSLSKMSDKEARKKMTPNDLMEYGFPSEIVGRFPVRDFLDNLTEKQLYQILTESLDSPLNEWIVLFKTMGVDIEMTPKLVKRIAKLSAESELGARVMRGYLEKAFRPYYLECEHGESYVVDKL